MSRHRDVRRMDYDDYGDDYDDDYYEEDDYDYDDGTVDAAAYYNRNNQTPAARRAASAASSPSPSAAVVFKTKPAKKKGKGASTSSAAPSTAAAASSRPSPGFAPVPAAVAARTDAAASQQLEDADPDMAAAIAASLADERSRAAFMAEAGLSSPAQSSASSTAAKAPSPTPTPLRSADAQQATMAALEQLKLEKQRQRSGASVSSASISAASTPKRQISTESSNLPHSVSLNEVALPSRINTSASSLTVPDAAVSSSSMPVSPRSPSTAIASSSSSSSSCAAVQTTGEEPPPQTSAKRQREVDSVLAAEGDQKDRINMVVIGHVDAGKSTLMGHLLFLQGRVSKKLLHRYEKESKQLGKSSFHYAWVLDETEEERTRGVTVDVATNYFETQTKKITLLDAPGHRDFIPNMITGAAQADAAILVVPATTGEFEGGFSEDGQIREHCLLSRSLGVGQMIVAVNKLDTVNWSRERYDFILAQLLPFLHGIGYKDKEVWTIPVSGLTGENIMDRKSEELKSWYDGPVLLDLIDQFQPPPRETSKPMRLCIQDVFKSLTLGQAVAGKVETGSILPKDRLLLLPLGETVSVKAMESRGENLAIATAGDNIEIGIKDFSDPAVLQVGQWLCDPQHPIPQVHHFRAQILTMNYKIPLIAGSQLVFFTHATTEAVSIHSLIGIVDKVSGAVTKRRPRVIPRSSTAIVEIVCKNRICLELFRNYKSMGRFSLRRGQETVAVGIVTQLYRTKL